MVRKEKFLKLSRHHYSGQKIRDLMTHRLIANKREVKENGGTVLPNPLFYNKLRLNFRQFFYSD